MATSPSDLYFEAAAKAGLPRDQVINFIRGAYVGQPKQLVFHKHAREADQFRGPIVIGYGGSRGPGKSHAVLGQVGLDDSQRAPGLKALFLRRIQKSAAESLEDLTARVFHSIPHTYKPSLGRVTFPNGSRILMGGFHSDSDIHRYIGIEYDLIAIEEATQISEDTITKIRGSLRTSRDDWRVRMYMTTNPGGIGHRWFKRNLVDAEEGHQFLGGGVRFTQANYRDNIFLKDDYVSWLLSLQGQLGEAWREGNWNVFEGMAFPNWDESIHVISPFSIPSYWPVWVGLDWGKSKPWAVVYMTKNPDTGRVYIIDEIYATQVTSRQQARVIREYDRKYASISVYWADPSLWTPASYEDEWYSIADEYAKEGIVLTKADNQRIIGKSKIDTLLADLPDGKPGLQVFSTCKNWIDTVPTLPSSEIRPEDVDTTAEDHLYDATRYALTDYVSINPQPPDEEPEDIYRNEMYKEMLAKVI